MVDTRKPSGSSAGWMPAFVFNSLLLLIPLLAVKALAATTPDESYLKDHSAAVLAEARRGLDQSFSDLYADNGATQREHWAKLVDSQLKARNMSAARGFLLAAPQMLSGDDARAIEAAAQADPSGTEDQRLLRASLLFLPSYIRIGYETSMHPRGQELLTNPEEAEPSQQSTQADANIEKKVQNSRSWLRGNMQNDFSMKLAGLAMASPPSATGLSNNRLHTAASVLKTAWKSNRLNPDYAATWTANLQRVLPKDILQENLEKAMADIAPLNVRAVRVQDAFAQSIDPYAAAKIGIDLEELAVIAEATSIQGAVHLLEYTSDISELRHARIIAEAGGDRAVALVAHLGPEVLTMNVNTVRWSQSAILQIMALAGAIIALFLSVLASLQHMARERKTLKAKKKLQASVAATTA